MNKRAFDLQLFTFIDGLNQFEYSLSVRDRIWNILFPDTHEHWQHLHVLQYGEHYYLSHINGKTCTLDAVPGTGYEPYTAFGNSPFGSEFSHIEETWNPLLADVLRWMKALRKDWIKTNRFVQEHYPLIYRTGIAPNSLIRESLPDIYRIDRELGDENCNRFISLFEHGYFSKADNYTVQKFTASRFFSYCKTAYMAAVRDHEEIDGSLSGREMYMRFADNRHDGLLDIDENSEEEFADWIDGSHPLRGVGGHPWEIKRGGNTTHIDLSVYRPRYDGSNSFKIELRGAALHRLAETVRMFLALHADGLPITIADPESIRKRILAHDNIGIVAEYHPLHRANQSYPREQDVYDVLYYRDLGRYKRRITPFITWNPLPILKPISKQHLPIVNSAR